MAKQLSVDQAVDLIHDGSSIMVGGFLGVGAPIALIDKLVEKGVKNLTLITAVMGSAGGGFDVAKLVENHQVKKIIASHIGTTPEAVKQYLAGEIEVEFYPMGTLIEKIRCGGGGLGGVLTPTGLGTEVEQGKRKITVDGREYLLETPLRADFALIKAYQADGVGNLTYRQTRATNPTMALAADTVIAEVDEIVPTGAIDPTAVMTPGILVNYVVKGYTTAERKQIYRDRWVAMKALR